MSLILYNYNSAGAYTWVGSEAPTSTAATQELIASNPLLAHAGRLMTRAAPPLFVWTMLDGSGIL